MYCTEKCCKAVHFDQAAEIISHWQVTSQILGPKVNALIDLEMGPNLVVVISVNVQWKRDDEINIEAYELIELMWWDY